MVHDSLVSTFIGDRHSCSRQIQRISDALRCDAGERTGKESPEVRIFGLVDLQEPPILFERRKLTRRVWDDSRKSRRVASVKRQKALLTIRSLDKTERIPKRVLDVFAEANENKMICIVRRSSECISLT